jgi:DNA-binding PadR family transcriptional regulator
MGENTRPGPFEELVLLAVMALRDNAYGVTIRDEVEERTGRKSSYGAIYATLDRLERKGFLSSRRGDPTPERGGKAKKFFAIEGAGISALENLERERTALRTPRAGWQPAGGAA